MDKYKKLIEYEGMLKDGVISEAEFKKLKDVLFSGKMAELGITDEAEFEEFLKKEAYREAVLILENKESKRFKEAFYVLENLGNWGDASAVISRYQNEYDAIKKQDELEKAERARKELLEKEILEKKNKNLRKIIVAAIALILLVFIGSMIRTHVEAGKYNKGLAGATYKQEPYFNSMYERSIEFKENGEYVIYQGYGKNKDEINGKYTVKKMKQGKYKGIYYVRLSNYQDALKTGELFLATDSWDPAPAEYAPDSFFCYDEDLRTVTFNRVSH